MKIDEIFPHHSQPSETKKKTPLFLQGYVGCHGYPDGNRPESGPLDDPDGLPFVSIPALRIQRLL